MNEGGEQKQKDVRPVETSAEALPNLHVTEDRAREIFGEDFLGSQEVERVFGVAIEAPPVIPFTEAELHDAKERGQQLVLYTNKVRMNLKNPESPTTMITPNSLRSIFQTAKDGRQMWNNPAIDNEELEMEPFYAGVAEEDKMRTGWALISSDILPDAQMFNFRGHCVVLAEAARKQGIPLNLEPLKAVHQFNSAAEKYEKIEAFLTTRSLVERPVETMYRLILTNLTDGRRLLNRVATMSDTAVMRDGEECVVSVGRFSLNGICIFLDPFSYIRGGSTDGRGHSLVIRADTPRK